LRFPSKADAERVADGFEVDVTVKEYMAYGSRDPSGNAAVRVADRRMVGGSRFDEGVGSLPT
jgi:hypothetical protein